MLQLSVEKGAMRCDATEKKKKKNDCHSSRDLAYYRAQMYRNNNDQTTNPPTRKPEQQQRYRSICIGRYPIHPSVYLSIQWLKEEEEEKISRSECREGEK